MKFLAILLLVGCIAAAPTSDEESEENIEKKLIVVNKNFYPKEWQVYKADHDIVSIFVPLNSFNFNGDSSESGSQEETTNVIIFFVEADIAADGKRTDQGLYVFKKNKATKLLDNGRDMAASGDDSKLVFLGASDGIYVYDREKNVAEKYGTVNDDIINIAKEKVGDEIYILTANKEVYKITNNGTVKEKIEDIVNAQQIVLDYKSNLYFYNNDKKAHVRTSEGVKQINGLPENPSSITLIKPPYLMDNGIPCVINNATYILYPNGTSEVYGVEFEPNYIPSAYSMEAAMLQYHAHNKKIYEYNVVNIVLGKQLEDINDILGDRKDEIQSFASNKKSLVQSNN